MASKKVTNVSKNPVTLADGTVIGVGEVAKVDGDILKDDIFYKAGYLKDGEIVSPDSSANLDELRKQITSLENQVSALESKNGDLTDALTESGKTLGESSEQLKAQTERAEKAEAELEALKAKK